MFQDVPPEAYSRVTNPERFRRVADYALDTVQRLVTEYDADLLEESVENRPATPYAAVTRRVRITPRITDAAPIVLSFTSFPGVLAEFGVGTKAGFPGCGCDACQESAVTEIERFRLMVEDVVKGRFSERVRGLFQKRFEYSMSSQGRGGFEVLSKGDPRLALSRKQYEWAAWPVRKRDGAA